MLFPALVGDRRGAGIHGQVLLARVRHRCRAVRFLTRYFRTRTPTPFAIYCAHIGAGSLTSLITARALARAAPDVQP